MSKGKNKPAFDRHIVDLDGATINGDEIEDKRDEYLIRRWIANELVGMTSCPFCRTILTYRHRRVGSIERGRHLERDQLSICPNCHYWHWYSFFYEDGPSRSEDDKVAHVVLLSKEAEFEKDFPVGCETEMAQQFRRKPDLYHTIDATRFEQFVAAVFKANHRAARVKHVGRTGDGGADLFIIDDGVHKWGQVRRRMHPDSSEPVETIRNLLGTLVLRKSAYGIVVSTADHFTYQALKAADDAREVGFTFELVDRGMLDDLLTPLLPRKPWLSAIREVMGATKYLRMREGPADLPDFLVSVMPHDLHDFDEDMDD